MNSTLLHYQREHQQPLQSQYAQEVTTRTLQTRCPQETCPSKLSSEVILVDGSMSMSLPSGMVQCSRDTRNTSPLRSNANNSVPRDSSAPLGLRFGGVVLVALREV